MENCQACNSVNREFIDTELSKPAAQRAGYKSMSKTLFELGEDISPAMLNAHRPHIAALDAPKKEEKPAVPPSLEQKTVIEQLKQEAMKVPATLTAPYFVLIHFLENLGSQEVKPSDAIRAAVAISSITGMRSQQQFLLDFAEKAFAPGGGMRRQAKDEDFPPVPEELMLPLEDLPNED